MIDDYNKPHTVIDKNGNVIALTHNMITADYLLCGLHAIGREVYHIRQSTPDEIRELLYKVDTGKIVYDSTINVPKIKVV